VTSTVLGDGYSLGHPYVRTAIAQRRAGGALMLRPAKPAVAPKQGHGLGPAPDGVPNIADGVPNIAATFWPVAKLPQPGAKPGACPHSNIAACPEVLSLTGFVAHG
jgi:hypothetical protein